MKIHEKIHHVIKKLATERPLKQITVTDVAQEAGISRQSVYRHIGGKAQLDALLAQERTGPGKLPEDTRGRILAAASRTFARLGYAGATLDEIAAEAGLTKGAVYWHFKNKNDLFLALLEGRLKYRLTVIPKAALEAVASEDKVEGVTAMMLEQLGFALADPDWPRLYLEYLLRSRNHGIIEKLDEAAQAIQNMVAGLIREFQKDGLLSPDLDPMAVAVMWTSLLDGLVLAWLRSPERTDFRALVPQMARILWEGLRQR
ncbi:MAG: transcriptional [Geobacteraceae bacterium]|nr:MAG: transcriptional [Geobacteraceae bacterium]